MRYAVELMEASVSKNASNTPALLKRSKRFHTLFQWPKRSGSARQRTFSTVKKCSASRKRRWSSAFLPRRGRQAANTDRVLAFPPTTRQAGAKRRKRVRPIVLIHLCRHWPRPRDSVGVL